ncbi:carbohydrate kinase family protein [Alteribacter aurantiacus]|uniref:carbohydrate kinase family protein n=1 Tax=Alteribacter aurantiacus TaxID=254410 RepID=UPI00041172B5|nr:carbohydrate kinase family protein [Alteribacter aurantiacus]
MLAQEAEVIVAGHICLDIIPDINSTFNTQLIPGKLINIGKANFSTGGAVPNTGLALHNLGIKVKLMGKIGDDLLGQTIIDLLQSYDESLTNGMIVTPKEQSSYTIVINPPPIDRMFLHFPGTNNTFSSRDIKIQEIGKEKLFHFGYPPLMERMYRDNGAELNEIMGKVKKLGLTTSLDLSTPDPDTESGRANWRDILVACLPNVDLFLPSFEEVFYMLYPSEYKQSSNVEDRLLQYAEENVLSDMAEELIGMGAAIVGIKLGEHGLYLRTTNNLERMKKIGACNLKAEQWLSKELMTSCYQVNVVGTTGAGDCTIAGFLAAILNGLSPEEAIELAVGVGAHNVEEADAVSGIPSLNEVQRRIKRDFNKVKDQKLNINGWIHTGNGIYHGPNLKGY